MHARQVRVLGSPKLANCVGKTFTSTATLRASLSGSTACSSGTTSPVFFSMALVIIFHGQSLESEPKRMPIMVAMVDVGNFLNRYDNTLEKENRPIKAPILKYPTTDILLRSPDNIPFTPPITVWYKPSKRSMKEPESPGSMSADMASIPDMIR